MFLGKSSSLAGYSFFSQSVQAVQPVAVRLWTIPSRIVLGMHQRNLYVVKADLDIMTTPEGTIAVAVWRIVVKKAATTALIPLISCVSLLFGQCLHASAAVIDPEIRQNGCKYRRPDKRPAKSCDYRPDTRKIHSL
jgi:hypothetical protein